MLDKAQHNHHSGHLCNVNGISIISIPPLAASNHTAFVSHKLTHIII